MIIEWVSLLLKQGKIGIIVMVRTCLRFQASLNKFSWLHRSKQTLWWRRASAVRGGNKEMSDVVVLEAEEDDWDLVEVMNAAKAGGSGL